MPGAPGRIGVTVQPQALFQSAVLNAKPVLPAGLAQQGGASISASDVNAGSNVQASTALLPNSTPPPVSSSSPPCDPTQSNLYCVYTVAVGDTLSTIAQKFSLKGNEDITAWEFLVFSNKPDIISEDDLLQIGQKIRVPVISGVVHTVLSAQTLGNIANRYDVKSEDIIAVAANNIQDSNSLKIGQEILIPSPHRFSAPAPASSGPSSLPAAPDTSGAPRSRSGFIWPASGNISSYFTAGHPLGIDIDFFGNPNQPVVAVAAGTVTFAGGNACCSYGYYVVVDHGNGVQTLYAHFSKYVVSIGERVAQGEVVGYGGRTGYATGNHLHFEVHVNGNVVNPLSYLP